MLEAASKLAFTLSVVMLGVAVSALVTRFAHPSVGVLALAIFRRTTDVLFFAYLLILDSSSSSSALSASSFVNRFT